jgi:transposase
VRNTSLWREVLGVEKTVIEGVELDDRDAVVVRVRPTRTMRSRGGRCGRRCAVYDRGEGRRRWRALDEGTVQVWVEADMPRVRCPEHGPTVRGGFPF